MHTNPGATGPNDKQHGKVKHKEGGEPEGGEAQTTASGGYGAQTGQPRQPGVIGEPGGIRDDDTFRAGAQVGIGGGTDVGNFGKMTEPTPQTGGYGAPMASTAPPPDMPPAA